MSPLILFLLTLIGIFSVPIVGVLLAIAFDRLLRRQSVLLAGVGLLLAAVTSTLLLLLPLRTCCEQGIQYQRRSALEMEGWHAVGLAAIPVLAVAVPVVLEVAVKPLLDRTRMATVGRIAIVAVDALATLFLIGIMYLLSAALVGFLYLPATAALGAATARSWTHGGRAGPRQAPTGRPVSG